MIPDGNYLRYYDDLMDNSIMKARLYQDSEPDKAMDALRDAYCYAVEFDRLFMEKPIIRKFTSPYFNLLEFDSADLLVYGPLEENKRIDQLKWWLSGEIFAPLSDREDFKALFD